MIDEISLQFERIMLKENQAGAFEAPPTSNRRMNTHPNIRYLVAALLLGFVVSGSFAQRPQRDQNAIRMHYMMFERPGPAPDTSVVDFLYRIPGNQFVFLREQSSGSFVARGEVFVELRDEDSDRFIRDYATIEIRRQEPVRDQDDIADYEGLIRLHVPQGSYRAIIEARDSETGRSFLDRARSYEFGLSGDRIGILPNPLLCYPANDGSAYRAFNRGQAIRFGSRGGILVSIRDTMATDSLTVSWRLEQMIVDSDERMPDRDSTLAVGRGGSSVSLHPIRPMSYKLQDSTIAGWSTVYLQLPMERLDPAMYGLTLTLHGGSTTHERKLQFPVVWENKPMSLNRFDLAVDALRYIASEEDIDDMVGFMADGGRDRFREFWKRKDPDPSTAYNEVMAEYYRRVDDTILMFSTQGELDGYRSDRGRIYILFGAPTNRNRVFRPESGPREIWEYPGQKKRFIFTDPSRTGDYMLSQTEDL